MRALWQRALAVGRVIENRIDVCHAGGMKVPGLLCAALLLCSPAWAGARFETKTGSDKSVFTLEGQKFRVDQHSSEGDRTLLVDNAKRTLTLLNAKDKTYNTLKLEQLESMGGGASDDRMKEALAQLPPEQRKELEAQGGSAKAEAVTFEPLHKKDKVAGKSCDWYRGLQGKKPFVEGCYIAWSASGLSATEVTPLLKTVESLTELQFRLGRGGAPMPGVEKAPGFPAIRIPIAENGSKGTEERLVSVEHLSVPAAQLQVPAGYKESADAASP